MHIMCYLSMANLRYILDVTISDVTMKSVTSRKEFVT